MGLIKRLFGIKNKKTPSLPETIIQLKNIETCLLKQQCYLEEKIKKEVATAKKNVKNKKAAIEALKRKKRYEKLLQQVDGVLTTIEAQREILEGANISSATTVAIRYMQSASKALRKANKKIDVDKILDDFALEADKTEEVCGILSKPVGFNNSDLDYEEIKRELADLENVAVVDIMPSVPQQSSRK